MKRGLGKGLEELLAIYDSESPSAEPVNSAPKFDNATNPVDRYTQSQGDVNKISLDKVYPNPNQPRKNFDKESLNELADSIRIHGLIQPIIVNKMDDGYMIIAGERRYKACKIAGLTEIDAIVKNYSERQMAEISIIENLQREDLNPIEIARCIQKLMQEYRITQEDVATRLGKSRSAIANYVRLLGLYPDVIEMVEKGKVPLGHAKCLVSITDYPTQLMLAKKVAQNKLTVRALEKEIDVLTNGEKKRKRYTGSMEMDNFIDMLQKKLGTRASYIGNERRGRIYIDYYSQDDLDRIYDILNNK